MEGMVNDLQLAKEREKQFEGGWLAGWLAGWLVDGAGSNEREECPRRQ
jgi:hypothetical protein